MTKARDIASAAPAPSTVSATELGYLDGVTSAIQTQLDARTAKSTLTTTGDIYYASAANTPARLGIGSTGNVLTVASGIPSWAAPAGGGKVLQVVSGTYSTQTVIASTSYSDTGLSLSITPTLNTSKVLVLITQNSGASRAADDIGFTTKLLRGATDLQELANNLGNGDDGQWPNCFSYLDSPATTASTTYKTQGKCSTTANSASVFYQIGGVMSTIVLMEIGA